MENVVDPGTLQQICVAQGEVDRLLGNEEAVEAAKGRPLWAPRPLQQVHCEGREHCMTGAHPNSFKVRASKFPGSHLGHLEGLGQRLEELRNLSGCRSRGNASGCAAGHSDVCVGPFARRKGPATPRKRRLSFLHYVHVPKTGSSFLNLMVETVCFKTWGGKPLKNPGGLFGQLGGKGNLELACPDGFSHLDDGGHQGVTSTEWVEHGGALVGMLRDPLRRHASGFLHNLHSCPHPMLKLLPGGHMGPKWAFHPDLNPIMTTMPYNHSLVVGYANCTRGCASKMLTSGDYRKDPCAGADHVDNHAVRLKLNHALEGRGGYAGSGTNTPQLNYSDVIRQYAFAGDTDLWKLSMCVWEAMFEMKGHITATHTSNVRKSPIGKDNFNAVVKILQDSGYRDPEDDALHKLARARLLKNAEIYLNGPVADLLSE